mmetsp:Transcript_134801/g.238464  ORF Transcript_134801/g.238464 Transcript_134801/m.238464 type:complete len:133 (-) Transcript_134801:408-806(-)
MQKILHALYIEKQHAIPTDHQNNGTLSRPRTRTMMTNSNTASVHRHQSPEITCIEYCLHPLIEEAPNMVNFRKILGQSVAWRSNPTLLTAKLSIMAPFLKNTRPQFDKATRRFLRFTIVDLQPYTEEESKML